MQNDQNPLAKSFFPDKLLGRATCANECNQSINRSRFGFRVLLKKVPHDLFFEGFSLLLALVTYAPEYCKVC